MAKIIGLPKLSPTMEEGTLVRWAKAEGDAIDVDDLLAEVETDKATMEFRSFDRGVLLAILVPEGETLKPDQPVAIVGAKGEDVAELVARAKSGNREPGSREPGTGEPGTGEPGSGTGSGSGSGSGNRDREPGTGTVTVSASGRGSGWEGPAILSILTLGEPL